MRRAAVLLALFVAACGSGEPEPRFPGVFVLGFDGMEPTIVEAEMAAGRMPNFSRLAVQGSYSRLGTTLPPESPVAWATYLTGLDPGGHGIFDFIHRTARPEGGIDLTLSTASSEPPSLYLPLFGYRFPLSAGGTTNLVRGPYFHDRLAAAGIPVSVVRVPSNYPPRETTARTFSGMGTPDLLGTYGVFSLFAESPPLASAKLADTAHILPLAFRDGKAVSELRGPRNTYLKADDPPYAVLPLTVYADRERGAARIDVGEQVLVLSAGEWSEWVRVSFPLVPGALSAAGIVRFYLKSVTPFVALYASPVNIDPLEPEVPICTPPDACADLARRIGLHYTQGMPEDTQALRHGVFDTAEFLAQAKSVLEENLRALDVEIERFRRVGGYTFHYFSSTDLIPHMMFRYLDSENPFYDAAEATKYKDVIPALYREMDRILGKVMAETPPGTRIVALSDHGFKSLRREMNLNTWLCENGYLAVRYPERRDELDYYRNVDWRETKAYAVGFSGIFLNLRGREFPGGVEPGAEAEALLAEIAAKLEAFTDPKTGGRVVTRVHRASEDYHGEAAGLAPDLVVGFALHYGCSDESATGIVSTELIHDIRDPWSGSHLMDPSHVPGILVSNLPVAIPDPSLLDFAPTFLRMFGLLAEGLPGRVIFAGGEK
ncbi:MAG: alkaline phosphatase family protein [Planctomycetes bacterium]|jgi:predicted AlkP superfamily phosphohydrolase/phosphomutase|nr:alkaline phosphatase family protein [Planctomycetota bacterium]